MITEDLEKEKRASERFHQKNSRRYVQTNRTLKDRETFRGEFRGKCKENVNGVFFFDCKQENLLREERVGGRGERRCFSVGCELCTERELCSRLNLFLMEMRRH